MTEARRRLSLRAKWTAAVLAVSLVPLALVAFFVARIQHDGLESVENELEVAIADEAGRELGGAVGTAEAAVHRSAMLFVNDRVANDELRLDLARDAIAGAALIDWVAVFAKDGAFIGAIEKAANTADTVMPPGAKTESASAWVRDAQGLRSRYSEPLLVDGVQTGTLVAGVGLEKLDGLVGDLATARLGRADCVVVVDRDLHVVAGSQTRWKRGSDLSADGAFRQLGTSSTIFDRTLDLHTHWRAANGEDMLGTIRTLPREGWAVLVERPEREAFGALRASRRAFAITSLAVAVLAVFVGAWLARRTTRPIGQLVELTRAFARREFDQKSAVAARSDELGLLGHALEDMAGELSTSEIEIRRRAAIETALARYLPAEVAEAVAGEGEGALLTSHRADITIVFADVAGFTPFVERARPEQVGALLNELFTLLTETVFRHGGMVDKFIGDCVMAVFGVRAGASDGEGHIAAALAAADDMQRFVEASAPRWRERFDVEIKLGIGIGTGEALVGNLGTDRRVEFTAVGDAVNLASRLEALALPGQILVTDHVVEKAPLQFAFRSLGVHTVRGRSAPLEILELVR